MIGYNTPRGKCIVGDSIELLKSIDDNSINLVMTSPPFALLRQKSYGNLEQEEYAELLALSASLLSAVNKTSFF